MKKLMSGNEAIAQGAWEAGIEHATGYPGTPSTEILENLSRYAEVRSDWSTNEKVALDVGMGISLAGKRALVTMKHVGVNVAADSLMVYPYSGVLGSLVLISADDPGMHSSQNEQDNRYFARFAKVPVLEPSDSQEAKDYVRHACEISERFQVPVMLRTTTRIAHAKGVVELGERQQVETVAYETDIPRWLVPPFAKRRRPVVEERLDRMQAFAETFVGNRVEEGDPKVGVIANGVAYQYAKEVLPDASYLRLGMCFPFPEQMVREFCQRFDEVLVVEEGEPFIQEMCVLHGITNVVGKERIPLMGELNPEILAQAIHDEVTPESYAKDIAIPPRPPMLCLGCPHRGAFHELKKMMKFDLIAMGDIGCYTLGGLPPYSSMQTSFCMGASVSNATGFNQAVDPDRKARAVGVIGDGTFLHGGIPGLMDMVYKQVDSTLLILDNTTTGMTGQQSNAASGKSIDGGEAPSVDLVALCKTLGVRFVETVDPVDMKAMRKTLRAAVKHKGPSVLITQSPCRMLREERAKPQVTISFDPESCTKCGLCYDLGCPAMDWNDETGPVINELDCVGCNMCASYCKPRSLAMELGQ